MKWSAGVAVLLCMAGCQTDKGDGSSQAPADTGCAAQTLYVDADGDGFGAQAVESCPDAGLATQGGDCDDADGEIFPGAAEVCDGQDNDCNGLTDDGVETLYYPDNDGDGFGSGFGETAACEPPAGHTTDSSDCDDTDETVYPDASELCDGQDNDCDGAVDEEPPVWYADADFDGYGDPDTTTTDCDQPSGYVSDSSDCDDGRAETYPGAEDRCDGLDNDCDKELDEDHKADWMLVSIHQDDIYVIDTTDASMTTLVASNGNRPSMDVDDGGTAIATGRVNSGEDITLFEIDACTGAETNLGMTDRGALNGIAFGAGGQLYGMDSTEDVLVRLDPATATATEIGDLGINLDYGGMAYDCAGDVLYGINQRTAELFTIDPSTGRVSTVFDTNLSYDFVGLEFDISRGLLWASTGPMLYEIDPDNQTVSAVGSFDQASNINDLALYPPCTE